MEEKKYQIEELLNYWPIGVLFVIILVLLIVSVYYIFEYFTRNKINNIKPVYNNALNVPFKRQYRLSNSWPQVKYVASYQNKEKLSIEYETITEESKRMTRDSSKKDLRLKYSINFHSRLLQLNLILVENYGKSFDGYVKVFLLCSEPEKVPEFKPFRTRCLRNVQKNLVFSEKFYFHLSRDIHQYKILFCLYKTNSFSPDLFVGKYLHEFLNDQKPNVEITHTEKIESFKYLKTKNEAKQPQIELSLCFNAESKSLVVHVERLLNLSLLLNNQPPNSFIKIKLNYVFTCKQIETVETRIYQQTCNPLIYEKFILKLPCAINSFELCAELWYDDCDGDTCLVGWCILSSVNEQCPSEVKLNWNNTFARPNEILDKIEYDFNLEGIYLKKKMNKVTINNIDPKTTSKTLEMILFDVKPKEINIKTKDLVAELIFENEADARTAHKLFNYKKILKNIVTASLSKVEKPVPAVEKSPEKRAKEAEKPSVEAKIPEEEKKVQDVEPKVEETSELKSSEKQKMTFNENSDVSNVLDQLNKLQIEQDEQREQLGEIIYPIAREKYPGKAAKLTGMLIDALQKLVNQEQIEQILGCDEKINILINAAYGKL